MKHIVVLGAGFGGTYTFKELHRRYHHRKDISLTLLNRTSYFLFTPLLHEVATGGISPENTVEPLRKLFHCCSYNLFVGEVKSISLKKNTVETSVGPLAFDALVIALGAETNFFNILGAEAHSFTLKSIEDALHLKRHIIRTVERAARILDPNERKKLLSFVVVGGGPTGVELAAELAEYCHGTFGRYYAHAPFLRDIKIRLIHKDKCLIPMFSPVMQERALKTLRAKKVEVLLEKTIISVSSDEVTLHTGEKIATRTPIWVAGVKPSPIAFDAPVAQDGSGRLVVLPTLQVKGQSALFALGDNAVFFDEQGKPLPALAQVAVKQAAVVAENVGRFIEEKDVARSFSYDNSGSMLSLGQWMALAEINSLSFWGHIAWLMWRAVYLSKVVSWDHKLKVAIDWTLDTFSDRDIADV